MGVLITVNKTVTMMSKEFQDILMEKLSNLDTKVNDFIAFSKLNLEQINDDVSELKKITKSTEKQAILTNSRVNKLEDKVVDVKQYRADCPGAALRDDLTFVLFFKKNYKVLLPSMGAFFGALFVAYSLLTALVERIM